MSITENFYALKKQIPDGVKLVAVSKTVPVESVLDLYNIGHKIFGENKAQELVYKQEQLPKDIEWHMIGHLQTNKVKYIAPFVSLIHSVDSLKLLQVINKEAEKNNRIINCLLQVHIAKEETKFGFSEDELFKALQSDEFITLKNIIISGLMGMASFSDNSSQVRNEFKYLKTIFNKLKDSNLVNPDIFNELSMGMSGDYIIAVEEGSTIVRIGGLIFGERNYNNE